MNLVIVTKEFATLKPGNDVYKLIGPVLVKQDQTEAKANVDKRLEFIKSEMYVPVLLVSYYLLLTPVFGIQSESREPDQGHHRKV